jgi:hypothetical protein
MQRRNVQLLQTPEEGYAKKSLMRSMDDAQRRTLRELFRKYKRLASRLRDGMETLEPDAKITFHTEWAEGKGGSSSFDEFPALVRVAALLRPFMNAASPVELHTVWNALTADDTLVPAEMRVIMNRNFGVVEELGGMALVLNQRQLMASDVYFAYAEGMFFDENPEAKTLLEGLSFGPGAHLVQFLFHSACKNFSQLVFAMLKVILEIEKNMPELTLPAQTPQCIYCLDRDGEFGDEEHVVPEAFGVDELVLVNGACKKCKLSELDQYLAEFEPLAILRVQNVPLTKKGKFPRAETRDFTMEKVKPRLIRVVNKTSKDALSEEKLGNGKVKLTLHTSTRKPVDILRLARAIFKIALGVVAIDEGVAFACDPRFDAARAFIQGAGVMPNHFLMPRNSQMDEAIVLQWHRDIRTVVVVSFWGVVFAVNLETWPLDIPPDAPADSVFAFWLGEFTKNGVVKPCVGECSHQQQAVLTPSAG